MNLKKIIIKEIDDFDWVRKIEVYDISNKNWIIHFDMPCDLNEVRRLQEWIYSQGFVWSNEFTIDEMIDCYAEYYFKEDYNYNVFDGYGDWTSDLESKINDEGYVLYKWSDIRKQLNLGV